MKSRGAFTLFELILAIALSATLLALIGTAVNLYLLRVDAGRTRVEEAQLARSILAIIAADVRAATTYQTQDISAIAQLAASAASFDVDDLDSAGTFSGGAISTPGSPGTASGVGSTSTTSSSGGLSTDGTETTTSLAPGLNGLVNELMLDVARLPRLDELFPTVPGQSTATATAAAANVPPPSDLKMVRYFLRPGAAVEPSALAATALNPQAQAGVGGLVRQTIDWAVRQTAEQAGNSQLLNSGQVLLAPEVTRIQFRYFDGTTAYDQWDMQERGAMPTAIEVRIWLDPAGAAATGLSAAIPATSDHMYLQTIDLPLAQSAGSTAASTGSETESSDDESSDSGETGTGTGFGGGSQF